MPSKKTEPIQNVIPKLHTYWKGTLQVGLIALPIKLHTGARAERIGFNLMHQCPDLVEGKKRVPQLPARLKQGEMECPNCAVVVSRTDALKGYEYAPGQYVTISKEELDALKPDSNKVIEVENFVDAEEIDPIRFESSLYITPDAGGDRAYHLIRRILLDKNRVAIAKVSFSGGTENVIAIRPYGDGLAMHTLFYPEEIKQIQFPLDQLQSGPREMELIGKLVDTMTEEFDPLRYHDSYAIGVKALIESKINKTPLAKPAAKPVASAPSNDLLSCLEASITTAKKRKKVA